MGMKLSEKRLFLLDMDGTIYLSDDVFDGTIDFLKYVKSIGGRYIFLSNNSSRGTDKYIEKLAKMGISTSPDDFLTSTDATIDEIKRNHKDAIIYLVGTESLKSQLRNAGLLVRDSLSEDINMLLLGYDTELTYEKLENACILLGRGVYYMATHPDMVCPTWYGSAPDCGSVIEMLKTAAGKEPHIIGKPKPDMARLAMEKFKCTKDETCLIGDRVYTDIACGVNAGIDTILVLSGEGTVSDTEKYSVYPTYIKDNIRAVLDSIMKGE